MAEPALNESELEAIIAAQRDESSGEGEVEASAEEVVEAPEAYGITSHVLKCRGGTDGITAFDKSTFIPSATVEVYTRVAFYDANLVRLVLSNWRDLGPGHPGLTIPFTWNYHNARVARSLVLWWHGDLVWRSWASC